MNESFSIGFIRNQVMGEKLEAYKTIKLGVLGPVNNAHAAFAELLEDLVMRNRLTDEGNHYGSSLRGDDGQLLLA